MILFTVCQAIGFIVGAQPAGTREMTNTLQLVK